MSMDLLLARSRQGKGVEAPSPSSASVQAAATRNNGQNGVTTKPSSTSPDQRACQFVISLLDHLAKAHSRAQRRPAGISSAKKEATEKPEPWPEPALVAPLLPPRIGGDGRKTLVLDLDATLIDTLHMHEVGSSEPDFVYEDSEGCRAKIYLRPHVRYFLSAVSACFEVVLFTAAGQRHADAVLKNLDPDGSLFHHRLYGHHTVAAPPRWNWVKDLGRLGRNLSQTLIVDDCESAALFHRENWVSIKPFSHHSQDWRQDTALLDILDFLTEKVLPAEDSRQALAANYNQVARRPFLNVAVPPGGCSWSAAELVNDSARVTPEAAAAVKASKTLDAVFAIVPAPSPFSSSHQELVDAGASLSDLLANWPGLHDRGNVASLELAAAGEVAEAGPPAATADAEEVEEGDEEEGGVPARRAPLLARVSRVRSMLACSPARADPAPTVCLTALSTPEPLSGGSSSSSDTGADGDTEWSGPLGKRRGDVKAKTL